MSVKCSSLKDMSQHLKANTEHGLQNKLATMKLLIHGDDAHDKSDGNSFFYALADQVAVLQVPVQTATNLRSRLRKINPTIQARKAYYICKEN